MQQRSPGDAMLDGEPGSSRRLLSLEEREAAYAEARERIFAESKAQEAKAEIELAIDIAQQDEVLAAIAEVQQKQVERDKERTRLRAAAPIFDPSSPVSPNAISTLPFSHTFYSSLNPDAGNGCDYTPSDHLSAGYPHVGYDYSAYQPAYQQAIDSGPYGYPQLPWVVPDTPHLYPHPLQMQVPQHLQMQMQVPMQMPPTINYAQPPYPSTSCLPPTEPLMRFVHSHAYPNTPSSSNTSSGGLPSRPSSTTSSSSPSIFTTALPKITSLSLCLKDCRM